jgi:hypothetical protein
MRVTLYEVVVVAVTITSATRLTIEGVILVAILAP